MTKDSSTAGTSDAAPSEGFERRDSMRRYATARLLLPDASTLTVQATLSLQGAFVEGASTLPGITQGALVGVEVDVGDDKPLSAVCSFGGPPEGRPAAGTLLVWQTLDFEAERQLARYLDEAGPR